MFAGEALEQVEALFLSLYGEPDHAGKRAIRHESAGRLPCEVKVYYSPGTATLATALGAAPCVRLSVGELGLLLGSRAALSALLSGNHG